MALNLILWVSTLAAWAQDYSFPTSAADHGHFYPTAYKDQGGTTDWNCGGITYSGHDGSDFGGGSWSGMDEGRDIVAAADGTVLATNDGEYDRCDTGTCDGGGGWGNYVSLQHADGKVTYYAHLKAWSVLVSAGQFVSCGTKMGEMGSSGYSTGPHVHFEVRVGGTASDPFDGPCSGPPTYWVDQGVYDGLPGLSCEDVPACTPVANLACGQTYSTANNGAGSSGSHSYYGCTEFTYSGPEIAFSFATNLNETATIRVRGNTADVDLFVLGSTACDSSNTIGCSVNPDASEEAVSFSAGANTTYTVVVDGWEGAASNFSLSAECAGVWPGTEPVEESPPPESPAPEETLDTGPFEPVTEVPVDPEDDEGGSPGKLGDPATGCSCRAGGGPGGGLIGAALFLFWRSRRARTKKVQAPESDGR